MAMARGAEHLFDDRQGALIERPRSGKVALVLQQGGEIAEARRRVGMLGAERLLTDRQGALIERPSLAASSMASAKVFATVRPS
jgi:hypothetical protein